MHPPIVRYLLHVLLPVAALASLVLLLRTAWRLVPTAAGTLTLLGGALVVYAGERLLERRGELGRPLAGWLGALCGFGALVVGWQALEAPHTLLPAVVPLALLSLSYRALARVPFAKELAVALCWAVGVALLPFSEEGTRWQLLAAPATWAVAAIVLSGTLLCDLKDLAYDAAKGVASSPVVLGERGTRGLAVAAALAAAGLACQGGAWPLTAASALLVWLTMRPGLLAQPLWGPIAVDAALCVPGVVAFFVGGA